MFNKDLIEKLMFKGQYEEAINLIKDDKSLPAIFMLINLYQLTGEIDAALEMINIYQKDLEEEYLPDLIIIHTSLLMSKNDVPGLMKIKEHYGDLPYHSQVAEENIRAISFAIDETIKKITSKEKEISMEKISRMLKSRFLPDVYDAINYIKELKLLYKFVEVIKSSLINNENYFSRGLLLIYLGEEGYNEPLSYKDRLNIIHQVIPLEISKYHSERRSILLADIICSKLENDISLRRLVPHILTTYEIAILPKYIKEDDEDIFEAIRIIANEYMGIEVNIPTRLEKLVNEIKEIMESYAK